MTLPQLFSAVCGGLLALFSLIFIFSRKTRWFRGLFWMAVGVAMLYAGFRPRIIELLGPDSVELRIRFAVIFFSFIVLTITLEAIRSVRMQVRYALLWLGTGCVLLIGSLYPDLATVLSAVTGMNYMALVLVVVLAFLLLVLFHFSVAMSRVNQKMSDLARALALAEERLRRLEKNRNDEPGKKT